MNDSFDPDQEQERLDKLEDQIQDARRDTDVDSDRPADDEHTFVDSGDEGEEYDDQTIAPPG